MINNVNFEMNLGEGIIKELNEYGHKYKKTKIFIEDIKDYNANDDYSFFCIKYKN